MPIIEYCPPSRSWSLAIIARPSVVDLAGILPPPPSCRCRELRDLGFSLFKPFFFFLNKVYFIRLQISDYKLIHSRTSPLQKRIQLLFKEKRGVIFFLAPEFMQPVRSRFTNPALIDSESTPTVMESRFPVQNHAKMGLNSAGIHSNLSGMSPNLAGNASFCSTLGVDVRFDQAPSELYGPAPSPFNISDTGPILFESWDLSGFFFFLAVLKQRIWGRYVFC